MQASGKSTVFRQLLAGACMAGCLCAGWSIPASAGPHAELSQHMGRIITIDNAIRYVRRHESVEPPGEGIIPPGQPVWPAVTDGQASTAFLPQLGYDPSSGFILGVKYSVVGLGSANRTLDIGATHSTSGQTSFSLSFGTPHLFGSEKWIGLLQLGYHQAPSKKFYGLGNNTVGAEALSTHKRESYTALFMLGYRLAPHWVGAFTLGYNEVRIGRGESYESEPRTVERFPNLPGIDGGANSPVAISLFYNTQRDLTRPARGWNNVFKIQHVGPVLGNDFEYTRYLVDLRYVHPIVSRENIIGFRLVASYIHGDDLPFYEFASIGGAATLVGFRLDRFRGQSRVFAQVGFRRLLADFNFYDIWRVRLDGAVFGGLGQVFLDESRLPDGVSSAAYPGLDNELQYSGGVGLRIALGEALVARLDAGFSKESKGLIYLTFGNRF